MSADKEVVAEKPDEFRFTGVWKNPNFDPKNPPADKYLWMQEMKGKQYRCFGVQLRDLEGTKNDLAAVFYHHNANKSKGGCELALSVDDKHVNIQIVNPTTGKCSITAISHEKFMDALDVLCHMNLEVLAAALGGTKAA